MKLIIYGILFSILSVPLMAGQNNSIQNTERYIREPKEITLYKPEVIEIKESEFEYEISREEAIKEVVNYWNYTFDEVRASKTDWRRARFEEYAGYLVDSVRYYQKNKERLVDERIDIILPNSRYVHLIIGQMVYQESSVNPNVVGSEPRFEVGFLQVWGKALNGNDPKVVRDNPELGMKLGVRWLAIIYNSCKLPKEHNINHWRGVLALYGAGPKAKKNGKCSIYYGFANKRVNAVKNYIFNNIEI